MMLDFIELSYLFLTNDMNVVISIFLAAGILCRTFPKKKYIACRIVALNLFGYFWSVLTNIGIYWVSWPIDPYEEISWPILLMMIIKYFVYFLMTFVGIWFCIRCSGYTLLYCATLSYCMQHIGEKTWELVEDYFADMADIPRLIIKYSVIFIVFVLIWALILRKYSLKNDELLRENKIVLQVAIAVIDLDIVLGAFSVRIFLENNNINVKRMDNLYSLLANLLVLFSITILLRLANSQKELQISRQVQRARENQYRRDQKTQDVLNVKCHDLKYQMSLLEEKMDTDELSQIRQVVEDFDTSIQTDQPAMDVVLANKQLICNGKQITLTTQVEGKAFDFMSEVDIYTMFENILDNAIEAVEQLSDTGERIISLTAQQKNGFLFIQEENYYHGEITFKNGRPLTTKADKNHHGFGTQSIQMLAQKYQGQMKIHTEDGIYTLEIVIPMGQKSKQMM